MEKKSVSSQLRLLHCQLATCSVSQRKDAKLNTLLLLVCTYEWTFVIQVMYFLPIHWRHQKSVSFWRWLMSFHIMALYADHLCLLPTNMEMTSTYLPLLTYCSTAFHSLFSCMYTVLQTKRVHFQKFWFQLLYPLFHTQIIIKTSKNSFG